jgi:hypothetical protein
MYEANPCTSNCRVAVSYCHDLDIVVVKVMDSYKVIEAADFTDWGMLVEIQEAVREMY